MISCRICANIEADKIFWNGATEVLNPAEAGGAAWFFYLLLQEREEQIGKQEGLTYAHTRRLS